MLLRLISGSTLSSTLSALSRPTTLACSRTFLTTPASRDLREFLDIQTRSGEQATYGTHCHEAYDSAQCLTQPLRHQDELGRPMSSGTSPGRTCTSSGAQLKPSFVHHLGSLVSWHTYGCGTCSCACTACLLAMRVCCSADVLRSCRLPARASPRQISGLRAWSHSRSCCSQSRSRSRGCKGR
jgi:hypothetical protein